METALPLYPPDFSLNSMEAPWGDVPKWEF